MYQHRPLNRIDEVPKRSLPFPLHQLSKADWKVDAVLSHTVPFRYIPVETFLPGIDQSGVDNSTERWLDKIEGRLAYRRWFAGHYHTEKTVDRLRIMFNDILDFRQAADSTA